MQLVKVDIHTGEVTYLCKEPRVFTSFASSPNDQYLMVAWLERPYSYSVPCGELTLRHDTHRLGYQL